MSKLLQRQGQIRKRQQGAYYLKRKKQRELELRKMQRERKKPKYLYSNRQWQIRDDPLSPKNKVNPGRLYRLNSRVQGKISIYQSDSKSLRNNSTFLPTFSRRKVQSRKLTTSLVRNGAELSWKRGELAQPNITFEPKSGSRKPITYDQRIAICVKGPDGPAYLHCKLKNGEMELALAKKPKYEWRIKGKKAGKSVRCDTRISLLNTVAHGYLVFSAAGAGPGLTWQHE